MTDIERMGRLTFELRELTRPQQYPGRIHQIRKVTDELWDLWVDYYAHRWQTPVIIWPDIETDDENAEENEHDHPALFDADAWREHKNAMFFERREQ